LQGAAEVSASGNAGAMLGARGCVEQLPDDDFLVTVAWQGVAPLSAPPASLACGAGQYDDAACGADLCRRAVTTVVRVASLN
jgi:type IV pilus assembly protein PilV